MTLLDDVALGREDASDGKPLWDTGPVPGSAQDFARRLRVLLPSGWFPAPPQDLQTEQAPVLAAMLLGFGSVLAGFWALIGAVAGQTRLATMSGPFLDMAAADFFGTDDVLRQAGESDAAYRARIAASLVATRNTRAAVSAAVQGVTGMAPRVIEAMNAADCHAFGAANAAAAGGGYGYGAAGLRYGSLTGGQVFIEAGVASGAEASVQMVAAAVARVKAAGVTAWIRSDG
ncbi:hypothetical protein [Acidomonas methanolica]|uniref:hypothetical protein n=1 Tax=Acidomonas methanolica TaxID=437 RepID=UPI00211A44D3|nr:hypothetical protein [Acidomonas methanolica]MCQ9154065.1 hypothetical protein [Acidomonas methanolica]